VLSQTQSEPLTPCCSGGLPNFLPQPAVCGRNGRHSQKPAPLGSLQGIGVGLGRVCHRVSLWCGLLRHSLVCLHYSGPQCVCACISVSVNVYKCMCVSSVTVFCLSVTVHFVTMSLMSHLPVHILSVGITSGVMCFCHCVLQCDSVTGPVTVGLPISVTLCLFQYVSPCTRCHGVCYSPPRPRVGVSGPLVPGLGPAHRTLTAMGQAWRLLAMPAPGKQNPEQEGTSLTSAPCPSACLCGAGPQPTDSAPSWRPDHPAPWCLSSSLFLGGS
jgi:hypothetical protein